MKFNANPFEQFVSWYDEAVRSGAPFPDAMALATSTPEGIPSVRMVLYKGCDERGFPFFTNFGSRKAHELDANPHAAIVFHWASLERQLRLEGAVEKLTAKESAAYFATRPRESQLGAWASRQSEVMSGPHDLEDRLEEFEKKYKDQEVPCPPFWGGYRLKPQRFEFWLGQPSRLHFRQIYDRDGDRWKQLRLYP